MTHRPLVLVLEDACSARGFLQRDLARQGFDCICVESLPEALDRVRSQPVEVALTDLHLAGGDGVEAMRKMHRVDASLPVVLLTAGPTVGAAISGVRDGAFDYLRKPIHAADLEITVTRALEHRRLTAENRVLREELSAPQRLKALVGDSEAMDRVLGLVRRLSEADGPVLVSGAPGTGKSLVARVIHELSERRTTPLRVFDAADLPRRVQSQELFGAHEGLQPTGLLRAAHDGTLLIHSITALGLEEQARLASYLAGRGRRSNGASRTADPDARIIATTSEDLEDECRRGHFDRELLLRFAGSNIALPLLRDRMEDVPRLVFHFLERLAARHERPPPTMAPEAMRRLLEYDWPGNVRQLRQVVEQAAALAREGQVRDDDLPEQLRGASRASEPFAAPLAAGSYRQRRREFERAYFREVLDRADGNVSRAAEIAGIHRTTFYTKARQLGLLLHPS